MNHTVQEQLRDYFEYFESTLESDHGADRLPVPLRHLDEQPSRRRGPGWAIAIAVAVAALAVVALAAIVVNALDRSATDTSIAPAVTTATPPVETTVPSELGPVVRDAGAAEQAGWRWLDHGDVAFKTDPGADLEIIGIIDSGVVLLDGHTPGQSCEACVLQLWAPDGSVQSHPLDFLQGETIEQTGVGAGLIWILLRGTGVNWPDDSMWVSTDGAKWDHVEVVDPDGVLTPYSGRALNDLWYVRFLRRGDQIMAINMDNGLVSVSRDEGQTFEVVDHNAEFRTRATEDPLMIRRTWATEDGFFLIYGPSLRLWHSSDGIAWELLGEVRGGPYWKEPLVPVASSAESLVLPLQEGRLLTMDFNDVTGFISEDNGLSWELIPGPYPFGDGYGPQVNQGWMHVWEPEGQLVWVSADGYDWYRFPGRTASSGDPAPSVFIDGSRVAIPPPAP